MHITELLAAQMISWGKYAEGHRFTNSHIDTKIDEKGVLVKSRHLLVNECLKITLSYKQNAA